MSLLHLFKFSYYFDPVVGYYFSGFWVLVGLLAAILIVSIWLGRRLAEGKNISGHIKSLWLGWTGLSFTVSILGLIYLFLRFENIMYFNWRFWPALLVWWAIGRGIYLVYLYKRVVPKKLAEKESRKMMSYYFRRRRQK